MLMPIIYRVICL